MLCGVQNTALYVTCIVSTLTTVRLVITVYDITGCNCFLRLCEA